MKIAIIGAGISGLSLGSWLVKNNFPKKQISIFEADSSCGGMIDTHLENNYLVESAASFFTNKKLSIHRLCLFLGLDRNIVLSSPEANLRYIYYNNHKRFFKFFSNRRFLKNLNSTVSRNGENNPIKSKTFSILKNTNRFFFI